MLGFNPGVLSFLFGIIGGIIAGMIALVLNAPKYTLILMTALGGAMAIVGGLLLMFNQLNLEDFGYSAVNQSLSNSFLWTMATLALLVIGIAIQSRTTSQYEFEAWSLEHEHHGAAPPTTHTTSSGGIS
jgi:hypothetical protein